MPPAGQVRGIHQLMTSHVRTVWLCTREVRPTVQCIVLLRFFVASALAADQHSSVGVSWVVAAVAWSCASMFAYLLNGVTDITGDRLNGSDRPLASGDLSPAAAGRALWVLVMAALLAATHVGPAFLAVVLAMLGLGWLYSASRTPAKAFAPASMCVLVSSGLLTYVAGYLAVPVDQRVSMGDLVILASVMSLWMVVGGMAKDLPDAPGDALAGRRSWPALLGTAGSRRTLSAVAMAVGLGSVAAVWHLNREFLPVALVVAGGSIGVGVTATVGRWRRSRRLPYRHFMMTQYLSHLTTLAV